MALVGRAPELGAIELLLARAAAATGDLIVVVGPPGSGKTALGHAALQLARDRQFEIAHASPAVGQPGRLLWAQLLRDLGAADSEASRLMGDGGALELDRAARILASTRPRLIVVDDIDRGGAEAVDVLFVLAARLGASSTAVMVTATKPLGVGRELRLAGLSEHRLGELLDEHRPDALHALWVASRGMPGVAHELATELRALGDDRDPIVDLAMRATSTAGFLDVDVSLIALLETAMGRSDDDATEARVLARLARELLGDASAGVRRRQLVDEALERARRSGDAAALAEVLDARLHALWDPAAARDRLVTASEIIGLARASADQARERSGAFWRFVALIELGRVAEAESVLAAFERASAAAGDAEAAVMVAARHAMLAILRGRFDEASRLTDDVAATARRAGMADARPLVGTLRGMLLVERGTPADAEAMVAELMSFGRYQPGHYYEATAAGILAMFGRQAEASAELQRVLPSVLAGSGPRWLSAAAHLGLAASVTRNDRAAAQLYDLLLPYRGRLVVSGGAVIISAPVSHVLGVLATQLGHLADAVTYLEEAIALEEHIGALPALAYTVDALSTTLSTRAGPSDRSTAAEHRRLARSIAERLGMTVLLRRIEGPADEWSLLRDGDDWILEAGHDRARLRATHGLQYLRALLAAPGRDIAALDLVAGGAGIRASSGGPVLDDTARNAYRRRLTELDARLDAADNAGDAPAAKGLESERQALLDELRRATGLRGRDRTTAPEAERARVNVTRALRTAIERITEVAPAVGIHLQASIRTGGSCRYEPADGGPANWGT